MMSTARLTPFFIYAYLWGAWNTKSVMMWFDPWCEWKMRTGNDDIITRKIGWQVGANWHSTRYISITADISTKYLIYNCSIALMRFFTISTKWYYRNPRFHTRNWLPDLQSSHWLGSSFLFFHCLQQILISSSGQPDWYIVTSKHQLRFFYKLFDQTRKFDLLKDGYFKAGFPFKRSSVRFGRRKREPYGVTYVLGHNLWVWEPWFIAVFYLVH